MKNFKKILPLAVFLIATVFIYSFFRIDGHEIKYVDNLSTASEVTLTVTDTKTDENKEYKLSFKQTERLKNLIRGTVYKRGLSSTITGELPQKRYMPFAVWEEDPHAHLQMHFWGGEYMTVTGLYGGFCKIKNDTFEEELTKIIEDAES